MNVNRDVKILLYANSILNFSQGMLGPLLAVFAEKVVGGNIFDIVWAWATYLIVSGLLIMLFGAISDAGVKKERLLLLGYITSTLFTFAYLFVHSSLSLMLVQAGLGLSTALVVPTWDALYDQYSNKKYDGTLWGIADAIPNVMAGPAIFVGGLLIKFSSFTVIFLIMGTLQLIATCIQITLNKKQKMY